MAKPKKKKQVEFNQWLKEETGFECFVEPKTESSRPIIHFTGNTTNFMQFMEKVNDSPMGKNPKELRDHLTCNRRNEWRGGSTHDFNKAILKGDVDMVPYEQVKQNLLAKGELRDLEEALANVSPRRKRIMSEFDGEWDFDRRWDIQPFQGFTKVMGAGRTIDLFCEFAIASGSDSEDIDKYSAIAWAISDIIEGMGISTNITLIATVSGIDQDRTHNLNLTLEVKKAGEYLAPNAIAAYMSSNFYRRGLFSLFVASCDAHNLEVHHGLGTARDQGRAIVASKGKVTLNPDVISGFTPERLTELLKAFS